MRFDFYNLLFVTISVLVLFGVKTDAIECPEKNLSNEDFSQLVPLLVPALESQVKGDAGKICVIGGSIEYTGAPYFAAISALKTGADLTYVVTTEEAASVIKSYSPDLIVYPYLNYKSGSKISNLLPKMDVVVIGPGLGRENELLTLLGDIIQTCKMLRKPLVIDADGLYAVSKNPSIIQDYPSPGVILTPNKREADRLMISVHINDSSTWHKFWGEFVSVLVKGEQDIFYSGSSFDWTNSKGGSGRRAAGQGDILAGSLGTIYNWALKKNNSCENNNSIKLAQSLSAFAAATLVRACNSKGFVTHGRSMLASDMIDQIHNAFEEVFAQ